MNPLYDPQQLDAALNALEIRYEKVARAKRVASAVYEDSDVVGIERLIRLEERYGLEKVQEAERIIRQKKPDNPQRSMGYLINTIKGN